MKQFYPAADGSTLAALEYHSLEIFVFNGLPNYYRFNLPDVADVQGLIWYKDEGISSYNITTTSLSSTLPTLI